MPVIGRMDEQVDEVLISPVGRRGARDDRRPPAGEAERIPPKDSQENPPGRGEDAGRDELPVWLL